MGSSQSVSPSLQHKATGTGPYDTPQYASMKKKLIKYFQRKHLEEVGANVTFDPTSGDTKTNIDCFIESFATEEGIKDRLGLRADEYLTVKLILSPLRNKAWLSNPVARAAANVVAKFGAVHADVQINDKMVGWFNSSLLDVTELQSDHAFAVIDLVSGPNGEFYNQIKATPERINAIAKCIVKWNLQKTYSAAFANCQHFAEELFEVMGIIPQYPPCIKLFLDEMKKHILTFEPGIHYKGEYKTFENHDAMDNFIRELRDNNVADYKELQPLLRAIDRAFHLQDAFLGILRPPDSCPLGHITKYQSDKTSTNGGSLAKSHVQFDRNFLFEAG